MNYDEETTKVIQVSDGAAPSISYLAVFKTICGLKLALRYFLMKPGNLGCTCEIISTADMIYWEGRKQTQVSCSTTMEQSTMAEQ